MNITWDISIGQIFSAAIFLMGMLGIAWRIGERFDRVERKVNLMFAWFVKQVKGSDLGDDEFRKFFGNGPR